MFFYLLIPFAFLLIDLLFVFNKLTVVGRVKNASWWLGYFLHFLVSIGFGLVTTGIIQLYGCSEGGCPHDFRNVFTIVVIVLTGFLLLLPFFKLRHK